MALPGQKPTSAFETCRDLLDKLKWEIEQLSMTIAALDPEFLKYACFNAAVTAWQITDWVALDADATQKAALGLIGPTPEKYLTQLQAKACTECRAVYLAHQVATASKHADVTMHVDPTVDAGAVPTKLPTWEAFISDGRTKHKAIDVFEQALAYWANMIGLHRIG
jgi:hypothetical protein